MKTIFLSFLFAFCTFALPSTAEEAAPYKPANNDTTSFLLDAKLWDTPLQDILTKRPAFRFAWMSNAQNRLRSLGKGTTTFEVPSGEIIIISSDDKKVPSGISISYYNKGDNGQISKEALTAMTKKISDNISRITKSRPSNKSSRDSVKLTKMFWEYNGTAFQLEQSINGDGKPEFLRLRIISSDSARESSTITRRSALPQNVVTDKNGDVYIKNIPMVDQGQKGYCACATAARIYQYYGLETDQHEIAQLAKSEADSGTSAATMVKALKRATGKFNSRILILYEYPDGLTSAPTEEEIKKQDISSSVYRDYAKSLKEYNRDANNYQRIAKKKKTQGLRNGYERIDREATITKYEIRDSADPATYREMMMEKSDYSRFINQVERAIQQGLPVAWALQLGIFKEGNLPQQDGGHMRLIIGYNKQKKQIIYSDSWGQGHEKKYMDAGQAFSVTDCILIMPPTR